MLILLSDIPYSFLELFLLHLFTHFKAEQFYLDVILSIFHGLDLFMNEINYIF